MKDFFIVPQGNDFIRRRNGLCFTDNNLDYMAQKVRSAISLFLGEWYLNKKLGIPYIPTSMEKIDHRPMLETALQVKISRVKGIKRLLEFDTVFDEKERTLKVAFMAQCDSGEILDYEDSYDFQRMAA